MELEFLNLMHKMHTSGSGGNLGALFMNFKFTLMLEEEVNEIQSAGLAGSRF